MLKFPRQKRNPPPEEPPPEEEIDEDGHELRMSIMEHLEELRDRLLWSFLALIIGTVIGIVIAGPVFDFLLEPYANLYPEEGRRLIVLGPTGSVVEYFRVSLLVGGIIAIPMITYQIMMFIVPGLTRRERRYVLLAIPPITGLFLIGVAFSWYIIMPQAIAFLEGFQNQIFQPEWTASQYLSFVTSLLFWMGVAFETPLVFFVLALLGLVTARNLIRNWRAAVVGASIAAAVITPTIDPVNMFLVMAPLLVLYVISIFLVMIGRRINLNR